MNEWKSISDELLTWCKSEAAEMYELCDGAAPDTMGDFGHMEFRHSKQRQRKQKKAWEISCYLCVQNRPKF